MMILNDTATPKGVAAGDESERRYLDDRGQAETPPPPAEPSGLLSELPADARAQILSFATRAGIGPREPELYTLLQSLGYHMYTTGRVADEARANALQSQQALEAALARAASEIAGRGEEFAGKLETALTDAAAGLRQSVVGAASSAVQQSLKSIDLSPVLDRLADASESAKRRGWLLATLLVASVAVLGVGAASAYAGWTLGSNSGDAMKRYMMQLNCEIRALNTAAASLLCAGPDGQRYEITAPRRR